MASAPQKERYFPPGGGARQSKHWAGWVLHERSEGGCRPRNLSCAAESKFFALSAVGTELLRAKRGRKKCANFRPGGRKNTWPGRGSNQRPPLWGASAHTATLAPSLEHMEFYHYLAWTLIKDSDVLTLNARRIFFVTIRLQAEGYKYRRHVYKVLV